MKRFFKILLVGVALLVCFIIGYQWAIDADKAPAYNTNTAQFVYEEPESVINKIEDGEEGIYYFGFAACPWCVELIPILDDALATTNQKAYVVDTRSKSFTNDLRRRLKIVYEKHRDDEFSVPFLVIIAEDGSIQTHVGTVENHDAHKEKLTDGQKKELKQLLVDMLQ
ncbi:transporter [Streptococcus sp. LQJ-218]|uniref:transporter n=1 Tax=Streptococcus sp. LQJ-218 TaxID=2283190 RepID=UPI000E3CE68A|nr:transporter [Streptococcus sp. LQJ-218]TAA65572.1 transporter [Streptococcus sp. LQJ-218]